jgi:hypothetical protein
MQVREARNKAVIAVAEFLAEVVCVPVWSLDNLD